MNYKLIPIFFPLLLLFSFVCQAQNGGNVLNKRYNLAFGNTNQERKANINIGLIGDVDTLRGVQFNLLSSRIRQRGGGVNWGIIGSFSQKDMYGLQYASIINVVGGQMTGLQLATIMNIAKKNKGLSNIRFQQY